MKINISCFYCAAALPISYASILHGLIESFKSHTGYQLFHTGYTREEALTRIYNEESLIDIINEHASDPRVVLGFWNGKRGLEGSQITASMGLPGVPISNTFTLHFHGSMGQLFAFEPFMIQAAEALDALSCRAMTDEVLRYLGRQNEKSDVYTLGEIAWLRGDHPLDVEGFEARRHGKGTLYRMERSRAEQDTETRAALIAGLRARLALE